MHVGCTRFSNTEVMHLHNTKPSPHVVCRIKSKPDNLSIEAYVFVRQMRPYSGPQPIVAIVSVVVAVATTRVDIVDIVRVAGIRRFSETTHYICYTSNHSNNKFSVFLGCGLDSFSLRSESI